MDKHKLIAELQAIGAIKHGSFTLKSGVISPIYIDLRGLISYPKLLQSVANLMWQQVKHLKIDLLCGVPYTALPFATALSLELNKPMVMVRKEAKDYGTKQRVEGHFEAGQSCLVLEDVVTSGMSIMATVDQLKAVGLQASYVVTLVDREQGGRENLINHGCEFYSVFTLRELLDEPNQ
jgi:uridine monophosphate synthetase